METETTRAERVAQAQALRDQGWKLREIAVEMGSTVSTVHGWLWDPDLAKQRARRERYSQPCTDCGKATDGSGGYATQPERCFDCAHAYSHDTRRWTPETIPAAVRRWAIRHGGRPPTATEWRSHGETWPASSTVVREMGRWNAAIRAAGYEPAFDHDRPTVRDPSIRERAAEMYRDGASAPEIAAEFDVTDGAVYGWLDAVGQPRRSIVEAQRLWRNPPGGTR